MKLLGKNLKSLRLEQKYSQKDLADRLGVSQTSIAHYEAGTRQPTLENLIQISSIFQTSIDDLLGNDSLNSIQTDSTNEKQVLLDMLLNSLLIKNEQEFFDVFEKDILNTYTIEEMIYGFVDYLLFQIGDLWEKGAISEADEHFATNVIRKLIHHIGIVFGKKIKTRTAVTFSVSTEQHTVGMELVNVYLQSLGVKTIFLGSSLPMESIVEVIEKQMPEYIFISITMKSYMNNLVRLVNQINKRFSNKVQIIIGGPGIDESSILSDNPNVSIINDLTKIEKLVKA